MTFTPLETALISVVGAVVVGMFVRLKSVSATTCKGHRANTDTKIKEGLDKIDRSMGILFRQQRALITYMDIPEDKKVEILNEKGDKG